MFKLIAGPASVIAGRPVALRIRYIHQGQALGPGASIRIGYNTNDGARYVQIDDPEALNYLQAVTPARVKVKLSQPAGRRSITFYQGTGVSDLVITEVNLVSRNLQDGESIDLLFGPAPGPGFIPGKGGDSPWELFYHIDPRNKYPLQSLHPHAPRYQQYITADGKEVPPWQPCGINIDILPDSPRYADLVLPTVTGPGENHLKIVIYDQYHNALKNRPGNIRLAGADSPGITCPATSFTTGDNGYGAVPVDFPSSALVPPLEFYIEELGIFFTNPVRVTDKPKNKIFWGDLHGHSSLSDGGRRGPDEFFRYAREITQLDFAALADHSFGLAVKGHWRRLLESIAEFSVDNEFIALLGYEIMLSPPRGHRNVYFPDTRGKILMADFQPGCGGSFVGERIEAYKQIWDPEIPQTATLEETIKALETTDFLWTAHNCGEITEVDIKHLALYETCSELGISEPCFRVNTSSTLVSEVFKRGISPGLMGSSDNHQAKAGFKGRGPYPSGLIAVLCPSLNRKAIYDALKSKHCYGTTGARILIEPQVEYVEKLLKVRLEITGTDRLERAWIFKNGQQVWHSFFSQGSQWRLAWEDPDFETGATCYIRIKQQDGEIAWINPLPFLPK